MPPKRRRRPSVSDEFPRWKKGKKHEEAAAAIVKRKGKASMVSKKHDDTAASDEDLIVVKDFGKYPKFDDLDYNFNVAERSTDGMLFYVAKEVLKDGLGLKGFRQHLKYVPDGEKIWRKVDGKGHRKAWISVAGLQAVLNRCRSDSRASLIEYLRRMHGDELEYTRKQSETKGKARRGKKAKKVLPPSSSSSPLASEEHEEELDEGYEPAAYSPSASQSMDIPRASSGHVLDAETISMVNALPDMMAEMTDFVKMIRDHINAPNV